MTEKPATFSVKDATRYAMIGALVLAALLGGYVWRSWTSTGAASQSARTHDYCGQHPLCGNRLGIHRASERLFRKRRPERHAAALHNWEGRFGRGLGRAGRTSNGGRHSHHVRSDERTAGIHRRDNFQSREGSRHHWAKRQGCFDPGESQRQTYRCNPRHEWTLRARRVSHPAETVDG